MKVLSIRHLSAAVLLAVAGHAHAQSALQLTINQGSNSTVLGFDSLATMFSVFNHEDQLQAMLPTWYDSSMDSTASMNNLGIYFLFSVSASANTVSMSLPSIGFDQTYSGNRDESLAKLKQDLKDNFDRLQQSLITDTPNSLVAGNPNSMQSQMAAGQFSSGFTAIASTLTSGSSSGSTNTSTGAGNNVTAGASPSQQSLSNLRGVGLGMGRFKQNGVKSQSSTIPLSYIWRFNDDDERRQITFSLPLTAGTIENSKVFSAQAGIGIGVPINPEWTLTPSVGYGITGSPDLLQASQQVSVALTSSYTIPLDDGYLLSFGNMVGYYSTVKLQIKDYKNLTDLQNTVLRNGALLAVPLPQASFLGEGLALELSFINTKFLGSALYIDTANEIGFTVGTDKRTRGMKRFLRVGLSFLAAKDSTGVSANFGYWF